MGKAGGDSSGTDGECLVGADVRMYFGKQNMEKQRQKSIRGMIENVGKYWCGTAGVGLVA